MPAKFKCVGSLGWDISVSYHVLQLLSSLTSRSNEAVPETGRSQLLNLIYQAIILSTTLFSKERFTKWKLGGWTPAQFKWVGSLGWDISCSYHVLQLLSSLTSRSTAIPETEKSVVEHTISCNYYAHHIVQQRKVHHNPANVGIHSQRLTHLRRAEMLESLCS